MNQPTLKTESWWERWGSYPARRPGWALLWAALVLGLALLSAARLEPEPSMRQMFAVDDPSAQALVEIFEKFSASDNLMLLVRAPVDAHDPVAALTAFADRLRTTVQNNAEYHAVAQGVAYEAGDEAMRFIREEIAPKGLYYLRPGQIEPLRQRLSKEGMVEQLRRNQALLASGAPLSDALGDTLLQDPLRLHEFMLAAMGPLRQRFAVNDSAGAFIGKDGRSLLVRIRAVKPAGDLDFTRRFMPLMRQAVADAGPGNLAVEYAGGYPMAEHSERVIRSDMILNVIQSMVLLQIVYLLVYRKLWNFPLTFLPVVWGIAVAFGCFALRSPRLTPVVGASGGIMAGLGVDYGIHYLSAYHNHRRAGLTPLQAARACLELLLPLSAACVTSMLGFIAVAVTRVPALRDFAVIGALGLAGTLVGALLLTPAVLQWVDRGAQENLSPLRLHVEPMIGWVSDHARLSMLVLVLIWVLAVGLASARGPVRFETDMSVMNPRPNPPMQAQADLARQFPGAMQSALVLLHASSPQELQRLAYDVDEHLQQPALTKLGIGAPLSVAMLLPDPATLDQRQKLIAGLDPDRIVTDFQQAVAESDFDPAAYAGYEDFLRRFLRPGDPPTPTALAAFPQLAGMMLPRPDDPAHPGPVTSALTVVQFNREFTSTAERQQADAAIHDALAGLPGATVTGFDIVSDEIRDSVRKDLPLLAGLGAALVIGWLFLTFRRPVPVGLTLIPTLFCLTVVYAVLSISDVHWNLINIMALPILLGTGVDNGIFLVSIVRRHRGAPQAARRDITASSLAMLMTSATSAVGFGSLMFTHTPAIQSLGLVLAVGMSASWVGSVFLLLPGLLLWSRRQAAAMARAAGTDGPQGSGAHE